MMNTNFLLVLFSSLILSVGCNSAQQNDNTTALEEMQPEKKQVAAVPENGEVAKLTRVEFLANIMDYEKNPDTWVYKGEKPSLIDFYADWCAPCRITSPIIDELAREYGDQVNFYKVDTDKEQELARVFGIRGIPSFLYIPAEGQPTMTSGIAQTPEETKQMFKDQIEKYLLTEQ